MADISFTYWCGGVANNELILLADGTVVFQPIDENDSRVDPSRAQARGAPHGNWLFDENDAIIVDFDHLARPDKVNTHVFKKLNKLVNAYTLSTRDGYDIPNPYHKHRALLIHNCVRHGGGRRNKLRGTCGHQEPEGKMIDRTRFREARFPDEYNRRQRLRYDGPHRL